MKHHKGVITATIVSSLLWGYQAGAMANESWTLGSTPEQQPRRSSSESLVPTTFYIQKEEEQEDPVNKIAQDPVEQTAPVETDAPTPKKAMTSIRGNIFDTLIESIQPAHQVQSSTAHSVHVEPPHHTQPNRSRIADMEKAEKELETVEILIPNPGPDPTLTEKQKISHRLFDRWTGMNALAWKKKFSDSDKRTVVVQPEKPTVFTVRRNPPVTTNRRAK